jgi:hypothetical protein
LSHFVLCIWLRARHAHRAMKTIRLSLRAVAWILWVLAVVSQAAERVRPSDGLTAKDWSGIHAARAAWVHSFREENGEHSAHHPGHGWRARFGSRGFIATADDGAWRWGMELTAWGFPGSLRQLTADAKSLAAAGTRLIRTWDDSLEEWYVNDARGLEHGFTVSRRPSGGGDDTPLVFDLAIRGNLRPLVRGAGETADFADDTQRTVLTYGGLKVFDADGRQVPARMTVPDPGTLRLEVFESGARFPLTIDPVAAPVYVKPLIPGGGDSFGQSVAVFDNTVVIGAHLEDGSGADVNPPDNNGLGESGAAYVFVRDTAGMWSQQAYLKASNPGLGDYFGRSVAIWGDTIVVGAPYEDGSGIGVNPSSNNNADQAGAAYIFVRSGTTWTPAGYLKASNTQLNDQFGASVSVSGGFIVVGAPLEDGSGTGINPPVNEGASGAGAAYLFVHNGTSWGPGGYVKPLNPGPDDNFGYSVSIFNDMMAIGGYLEDGGGAGVDPSPADGRSDSGAVWVFRWNGAAWSQDAYLKASNPGINDWFGYSVAAWGRTVVCGAPQEDGAGTGVNPPDISTAQDSGAAYVFIRSNAGVWSQQAYLKASNTGVGDQFGYSVALADGTLGVGAPQEDGSGRGINPPTSEGNLDSGAAYVFYRRNGWLPPVYVKATNPEANDRFGSSVGVSFGYLVACATSEDGNGSGIDPADTGFLAGAGAAYIFFGVVPLRDQDDDGLPDVFETYFGTDPSIINLAPWTVTHAPGRVRLWWPEANAIGVVVEPQWSPDMVTWLVSGESRNGIAARTITLAGAGPTDLVATLETAGLDHVYLRLRLTCP